VRLDARGASTDEAAWAGIRTILVPPDIVAVKRRSPVPVRKRTPWHPTPDGEATTERCGARDWFSDRLFVEAQDGHHRSGYCTSIAVHVCCAIVLVLIVLTRPVPTFRVNSRTSMVMPATLSMVPLPDMPWPASRSIERTAPKPEPRPSAAPPPPAPGASPAAPIEAPSTITPETGGEGGMDGVEGGVVGGVVGGVAGGVFGGVLSGTIAQGPALRGPMRPGGGIQAPRKVKDVKPVYPQGGLTDQTRGTVVIEATIGVDGKVAEAKIIHSVPALDQAAIDAVRQWEYLPSVLNGVPVAVIMTVVVNFAIQ
jgi:protein TonB